MIDFQTITKEKLIDLEEKRKEEVANLPFHERPSTNTIINELRFNHGFYQVGPFLLNKQMDKLELAVIDAFQLICLHYIEVSEKRKGKGMKLLGVITSIADQYGYDITLEIDETKGTPHAVLEKFYRSFGFTYTEEKTNEMIRKPKKHA